MRKWMTLAAACLVGLLLAAALPAAAMSPPGKQVVRLRQQVAALKAKVRRLQAENTVLADVNAAGLRREIALQRHVAAVDPCPITIPNGSKPPGSTFGAEFHGNGSIWVGTWHSNVVVWPAGADGSITTKFGWWRGVPGKLRIEGRRLDATAPPLVGHVPDGYGDSGFQSSGITFPGAGCWQVTGRVGDASLTFVTLVLAA
jgi:outer membrane murein-binding lipoprotein Lpp